MNHTPRAWSTAVLLLLSAAAFGTDRHPALHNDPFHPDRSTVDAMVIDPHTAHLSADLNDLDLCTAAATVAGLTVRAVALGDPEADAAAPDDGITRVFLGFEGNLAHLLSFFSVLDTADIRYTVPTYKIATRRRPGNPRFAQNPLEGHLLIAMVPKQHPGTVMPHPCKVSQILDGLAQTLPRDTYLSSLRRKGKVLLVQGYTRDATTVVDALFDTGLIDGGELTGSPYAKQDDTHRRPFTAQGLLDPEPL